MSKSTIRELNMVSGEKAKDSNGQDITGDEQDVPEEPKCVICQSKLNEKEDDDFEHELCSSCKHRPEARRLGISLSETPKRKVKNIAGAKAAREFTAAEKELIRRVHGYMPAEQLLSILNERLLCDLGPDALPYTMEQMHAEIDKVSASSPTGGHDRASLRRLLANARRNGTLDAINEQVINDFAIVFSLNQKQVLVLKDTILPAKE